MDAMRYIDICICFVAGVISQAVDVVFVIDGSSSVSTNEFKRTKCLLKNLTDHLDVRYRKVKILTKLVIVKFSILCTATRNTFTLTRVISTFLQ